MYWSDLIELGNLSEQKDENGYPQKAFVPDTTVYAEVKSTTRAEFYAASAAGIAATATFEVHMEDYTNQTAIRHSGKIYAVVRAYHKGGGNYELTCKDAEVNQNAL